MVQSTSISPVFQSVSVQDMAQLQGGCSHSVYSTSQRYYYYRPPSVYQPPVATYPSPGTSSFAAAANSLDAALFV